MPTHGGDHLTSGISEAGYYQAVADSLERYDAPPTLLHDQLTGCSAIARSARCTTGRSRTDRDWLPAQGHQDAQARWQVGVAQRLRGGGAGRNDGSSFVPDAILSCSVTLAAARSAWRGA